MNLHSEDVSEFVNLQFSVIDRFWPSLNNYIESQEKAVKQKSLTRFCDQKLKVYSLFKVRCAGQIINPRNNVFTSRIEINCFSFLFLSKICI